MKDTAKAEKAYRKAVKAQQQSMKVSRSATEQGERRARH